MRTNGPHLKRSVRTSFLIGVIAVATIASPELNAHAPFSGRLTAGDRLDQVLQSISRSSALPILCELPQVDRRIQQDSNPQTLTEALQQVSFSFHLHAVQTHAGLIFIRRYVASHEEPGNEIAELTAIASDIHGLVRPLCPVPLGRRTVLDEIRMARSFSADQIKRLQQGGIPVLQLPKEQAQLWLTINERHGYTHTEQHFRQIKQVLTEWSRARLMQKPRDSAGQSLVFHVPRRVAGEPGVTLGIGSVRGEGRTGRIKGWDGKPKPLVTNFVGSEGKQRITLTSKLKIADGKMTLGALVSALESTSRMEIEIPAYAGSRRVLAYIHDARVGDVVSLLELLYGWKARLSSGKVKLERPVLLTARNAVDFHTKVRAALPPTLHHAWSEEAEQANAARNARRVLTVSTSIERQLGKEWQEANISALDAATQRIVAAMVFDRLASGSSGRYVRDTQPPMWLSNPESGVLTLTGEVGPGKNPLLRFHVPRPDGGFDRWGWYVGTNSIESGIRRSSSPPKR